MLFITVQRRQESRTFSDSSLAPLQTGIITLLSAYLIKLVVCGSSISKSFKKRLERYWPIYTNLHLPEVVARACYPANWRLGLMNSLRAEIMGVIDLCRSAFRAKLSVSMLDSGKLGLFNEERTGPEWKHSNG